MNATKQVTPPDMKEYFEFLDDLRESGATNMFGAASYVQDRFGLDKQEARKIHQEWMNTFSARKDAGEVKENGGLKVTETRIIDFDYDTEDDED